MRVAALTRQSKQRTAFLDAAHHGRVANLLTMLAPDAVMHVDPIAHRMGAEAIYAGASAIGMIDHGHGLPSVMTIDGKKSLVSMRSVNSSHDP